MAASWKLRGLVEAGDSAGSIRSLAVSSMVTGTGASPGLSSARTNWKTVSAKDSCACIVAVCHPAGSASGA